MEVAMSRTKAMVLSLSAVFVIGAIVSASASALTWYQCSKVASGRYATQAACESLTATSGEWEWLPLLATAAAPLPVYYEGVSYQQLSVASGAFVIECHSLEDTTDLWNEGGNGKDLLLGEVLSGCSVSQPTGCQDISSPGEPNGTIRFAAKIPSKLVTKEILTYDEIEQNANKELATIDTETSKGSERPCGVMKLTNKLKGSYIGKIFPMTTLIEFENKSGAKELEMNTLLAKYKGIDEQRPEAGMVNVFAE
jgi:hypothetical protein